MTGVQTCALPIWRDVARNDLREAAPPYSAVKTSVSLQPNGVLPRARSTYEVSVSSLDAPPPLPLLGYGGGQVGSPTDRLMMRREFPLSRNIPPSQRPVACFYSPAVALHQAPGGPPAEYRTNMPLYIHPHSPGGPY